MPIYGYRCEQCGHELEVMQSISEAPLRVCPNCGGPLRKKVYAAGIIYKGSGYYTTDYKAAGSSSSSSNGDGGSKSETVSDTKTEAPKSESKPDSQPAAEKPSKAKASTD